MKKYYLKPNMEIVELKASQYLLTGSLDIDSGMVIPGGAALAPGLDLSDLDDLDLSDLDDSDFIGYLSE